MSENGQIDRLEAVFGAVADCTHCEEGRRRTVEEVVELGVELAREGREGRKVGTLFVVGDVDEVLARSRPLILDPLHGHPRELLHVADARFRETVKELALLDGAFVVGRDGVFVSAGRFIDVDLAAPENFPHAARPPLHARGARPAAPGCGRDGRGRRRLLKRRRAALAAPDPQGFL